MQAKSGVVVIIEDDAAMRKSLQRLLDANGYSTVAFASAEAYLHSGISDAALGLVLDINLPGMSGIDLGRYLAAHDVKVPVVFITSFDDVATRNEALAVGCVEFLQKPFEAKRLIEALESGREA